MSKRLRTFLILFVLVGLATFFMWDEASGNWSEAILLGIIGGIVVSGIVSFAVPFIKKQKKNKGNS